MSVEVLKSKVEIAQARQELRSRGLSFTGSWWQGIARKLGVSRTIKVGDEVKSWDVLKTAKFIEKHFSKNASILDMGAFASELLYVLHHLHYSNLTGIDLNPQIKQMDYADAVRYEVSDFMHTPFDNESFDVITAISVIEHGFTSKSLLAEVSRLLRPQGYFIASFDYWPQKVDTTGTLFFGMDWKIFSKQEVQKFIDEAVDYNLCAAGNINLEGQEKAINCANKAYTFGWLALQKSVTKGRAPT